MNGVMRLVSLPQGIETKINRQKPTMYKKCFQIWMLKKVRGQNISGSLLSSRDEGVTPK